MQVRGLVCLAAWFAAAGASCAFGQVTVFARDLAGFQAAAPGAGVVVDFEAVAAGTDITGVSMGGMTLLGPGAALIVVRGEDTMTPGGFSSAPMPELNVLVATSGEQVLSPGGAVLGPGPNASVVIDDLTIVFDEPVSAFGIDHLSQSADGIPFTNVRVFDAGGAVLHSGGVRISNLGGGGAAGAADFWGIVSTERNIARIEFDEGDSNAVYPDCNIGFDTIRADVTPRCPADWDGSGGIDGDDIGAFFADWQAGEADIDNSGGTDGDDITVFFEHWQAGC